MKEANEAVRFLVELGSLAAADSNAPDEFR
jgi:hypothetical protein